MKLFFVILFNLIVFGCYSQFNPPWYNDPSPTPQTYMTSNGAQYRHETYLSTLNGSLNIGYWAYLPPAYLQDSSQAFSVIYWLHGGSTGGLNENSIPWIAEDFMETNSTFYSKLRNSIVIFPNGLDLEFFTDRLDNSTRIESSIINELIPHINNNYNISQDRTCKGIAGFSMGGYGAIKLALKYPTLFGHAISIDGPAFPSTTHDPDYANDNISFPFYLSVFDNDVNYLNLNSLYTIADNYFANNSNLPVNLFLVTGQSDPLEGYHSTNFVNYLESEYNFTANFILNPNMPHDIIEFLDTYGDTIFSFQENSLCNNTTASENEVKQQSFEVYPTLVKEKLFFKYKNDTPVKISIYDVNGAAIRSNITLINKSIVVRDFKKGIYLIIIEADENVYVKKFIKQ